jgi:hypothetical protein
MKHKILSIFATVLMVPSAPGWTAPQKQDQVESYDCQSLINLNNPDVTGKWVAQIAGRQGTIETTFTFKADEGTVTGTVSTPEGNSPISEGKISETDLSFVTAVRIDGSEIKLLYKGSVSGEEIKFTRQIRGGGTGGAGGEYSRAQEFIAKKAK